MFFNIQSTFKNPRVVPVSVDTDGSLLIDNRAVTVTKTAGVDGTYVISLDRSCQQLLFGYAICKADGVARHVPQIAKADITAKQLTVRTYNASDVLADAAFDIFIIGSDGGLSSFGVPPNDVMCSLAWPKFLPFKYNGTTDTQEARTANFGTFSKTATGRYTLTLTRTPFQGNFYVAAISENSDVIVEYTNKDHNSVDFELTDVSGAPAAADSTIYAFVIGSHRSQVFNRIDFPLVAPLPYLMMNPFEYIGSGTPADVRGEQYVTGSRAGVGDYDFTFARQYPFAGWGLAQGAESAIITAVNQFASTGFTIQADGDGTVFGLDLGFRRGTAPAS